MIPGIPRFVCYATGSKPIFKEPLDDSDWDACTLGELVIIDVFTQSVFVSGKREDMQLQVGKPLARPIAGAGLPSDIEVGARDEQPRTP